MFHSGRIWSVIDHDIIHPYLPHLATSCHILPQPCLWDRQRKWPSLSIGRFARALCMSGSPAPALRALGSWCGTCAARSTSNAKRQSPTKQWLLRFGRTLCEEPRTLISRILRPSCLCNRHMFDVFKLFFIIFLYLFSLILCDQSADMMPQGKSCCVLLALQVLPRHCRK